MKKLILIAITIITTSASAQSWWDSKRVRGNGDMTTKYRTTDDYDGVSVGGSFDVILVKGKEGKIKIEAESNLMPYIVTTVERGILKVKFRKNTNVNITRDLVVTVPVREIEKVALGGSGKIESDFVLNSEDFKISLSGSGDIDLNLNARNTSTSIAGSGDIRLKGKSNYLKCSVTGSGSIKAYNYNANEVKSTVTGSGNIKVSVRNKIKATIVGSGNIYYKGNPKHVDSKSVGSGDVIERN